MQHGSPCFPGGCASFVVGPPRPHRAARLFFYVPSLRRAFCGLAWVSEGWAYAKQILMFSQGLSEVGRKACAYTLGVNGWIARTCLGIEISSFLNTSLSSWAGSFRWKNWWVSVLSSVA